MKKSTLDICRDIFLRNEMPLQHLRNNLDRPRDVNNIEGWLGYDVLSQKIDLIREICDIFLSKKKQLFADAILEDNFMKDDSMRAAIESQSKPFSGLSVDQLATDVSERIFSVFALSFVHKLFHSSPRISLRLVEELEEEMAGDRVRKVLAEEIASSARALLKDVFGPKEEGDE